MVSRRFGWLPGVILMVGAAGGSDAEKPAVAVALPPLNQKVVEFAREHRGEKVGDGQCTTLARDALRAAGAKRFRSGGTGGDYVWGRPVASFRDAMPGDLVQFRDAVFRGKTRLSGRRILSWHQEYPHHTAVIAAVRDAGKTVVLLHQNVGPDNAPIEQKQRVSETILRVDGLQKGGRLWIYRPIASDDDDKEESPAHGLIPGDRPPSAPRDQSDNPFQAGKSGH